jgi:hypothetical protein
MMQLLICDCVWGDQTALVMQQDDDGASVHFRNQITALENELEALQAAADSASEELAKVGKTPVFQNEDNHYICPSAEADEMLH